MGRSAYSVPLVCPMNVFAKSPTAVGKPKSDAEDILLKS